MVENRNQQSQGQQSQGQSQMGQRGGREGGQQGSQQQGGPGARSMQGQQSGDMSVGRGGRGQQSSGQSLGRASSMRALDPWTGFRSEMERMFDNFFGSVSPFAAFSHPSFRSSEGGFMVPRVDVKETENAIAITAELPGIKEDDIELTFRDGILTLRGEKRQEREEQEGGNVYFSERRYGSFERSFRIPDSVQPDACEASFEDGVLHITLPKRETQGEQSHRIPIGRK